MVTEKFSEYEKKIEITFGTKKQMTESSHGATFPREIPMGDSRSHLPNCHFSGPLGTRVGAREKQVPHKVVHRGLRPSITSQMSLPHQSLPALWRWIGLAGLGQRCVCTEGGGRGLLVAGQLRRRV